MSYTNDATFNLSRSVFAGMTPAQLQLALANAQQGLIALQSGQQVATVSYGQGNGTKHVQFRQVEQGALVQLIQELQACLGLRPRSRAGLRFSF